MMHGMPMMAVVPNGMGVGSALSPAMMSGMQMESSSPSMMETATSNGMMGSQTSTVAKPMGPSSSDMDTSIITPTGSPSEHATSQKGKGEVDENLISFINQLIKDHGQQGQDGQSARPIVLL